ncbi:MAG: cob(I)yrinic acid a,c-diamide adenosyltransferase [Patescibacteria group bacterium]|nr:cob(I)yrinic acid a,c-diamide adenosyltransferase [Patescibacteria group bacterium]
MKTSFFTGSGDEGVVKIGRVRKSKDNEFFKVLGSLDRLNSWLGFCRIEAINSFPKNTKIDLAQIIKDIQEILFIAQAEVAAIGFGGNETNLKVTEDKIKTLENLIEVVDKITPPLKKFIIPGNNELSARLDIARVFARDLERDTVGFSKSQNISKELLRFFNRLSSALFALARYANFKLGVVEEHPTYT